jgi:hypothetical protein
MGVKLTIPFRQLATRTTGRSRRVSGSVRGTRNGLRRTACAVSGNYVCNARTYLTIVTHNKGNASVGVKMYGEGFRFLVHSFARLSTKIVILPLGELLQKMANPVNTRVLYFRNS